MNLTWHIVRKDLRRLWPWLALLFGTMLARYINFYAPGYDPDHDQFFGSSYRSEVIEAVLFGLSLFATALAAVPLVHEDPVTGDRAFWLTRPISGGRLLAAKSLAFTFVFVLAPLTFQLGWWLLHGYSLADITVQLPTIAARQVGTAFAAFCFALLTRNLGSFLLSTLIATFALVAAHAYLIDQWLKLPSRADDFNRERIELIVALLALPALIVHQYLTRNTRRTLALFCSSLVLCLSIYAAWSWPLFKRPSRFAALPAFIHEPDIKASLSAPIPVLQATPNALTGIRPSQGANVPALAITLTVGPIPAGHIVQILDTRFPKAFPLFLRKNPRDTLPTPTYPETYFTSERILIFDRGSNAPPKIDAPVKTTFAIAVRRPEIAATLPLIVNASGSRGPYRLRIASIKNLHDEDHVTDTPSDGRETSARTITSRAQNFTLILDECMPSFLLSTDRRYAEPDRHGISSFDEYPVVNPAEAHSRHAYFLVSRHYGAVIRASSVRIHASISADGVRRRQVRVEFPIARHEVTLADYNLTKVIAPLVGIFERSVTLPAAGWTDPLLEER